MVNPWTGEWFDKRCGSARMSRCEYCAWIKRGDIAAIGRSGWAPDRPGDRGYWLTLTAPGADVLPWDTTLCSHSPGVACSGDIGCVCEADALARWHNDLGARWNHFVTDLRRSLGVEIEYFKTWEGQARGALHAHAMLRVVGVVTDRRVRAAVRLLARRHGFGGQLKCDAVDLSDARTAARVAGYCAKYASKNADALPLVRRLDVCTGEVRFGGIRSWSASWRWGDTMKAISARRCAWAGAQSAGGSPPPGGVPGAGAAAAGRLDLNRDRYASPNLSGADPDPSEVLSAV